MIKTMKCTACEFDMSPTFCRVRATEIPLSCPHAADPTEHADWAAPVYGHTDGKEYVAVSSRVEISLYDDGTPTPTDKDTGKRFLHPVTKKELFRRGAELDLKATLKKPRAKPKERPHLHWKCGKCGFETTESVKV